MHRDCKHGAVCPRNRGKERLIQRTIGIQPSQEAAVDIVESSKGTTDQNFAVRLDSDNPNRTVRCHAWIKRGVQGAVGIQAGNSVPINIGDSRKVTANQNFAVLLRGHCINDTISAKTWIETTIKRPVCVQDGYSGTGDIIECGKVTPDEHPAVRKKCHRVNRVVRSAAGVEELVDRAICIEPGNVIAVCPMNNAEESTDEQLAVWL